VSITRNLSYCYINLYITRFIGPFLETVNKWERTLALISEIIDEWLVVQRKCLFPPIIISFQWHFNWIFPRAQPLLSIVSGDVAAVVSVK